MALLLRKKRSAIRNESAIQQSIQRICELRDQLRHRTDDQLAEKTIELSEVAVKQAQVDLPEVAVPGLALICEALRRVTGLSLYEGQIRGALVISAGKIAEMQTGEGKTLTAASAAFLHGLTHRGVHVSTTNAYLADRDFQRVSPAFQLLGISAGLLRENDKTAVTREAYCCDITYGTGYQFGFDYLKDQTLLRQRAESRLGDHVLQSIHGHRDTNCFLRQREFTMAIVDEADSVMIDEAMVPLLLSTPSTVPESDEPYKLAYRLAQSLALDGDFAIENSRIVINSRASAQIHQWLRQNPVRDLVRPWTKYVENALHADHLLRRDRDYVVRKNEVQIVDPHTGRIFEDRTWRDGLHQAVETKEGVAMRPSRASSARITRQRFFHLYDRLAGLTGTATDAAEEFGYFYGLPTVVIPTNRPSRRKQQPTRFFGTAEKKMEAIGESVRDYHRRGQPLLVGTQTIEQSMSLSKSLHNLGVPHVVLNGVQNQAEAEIISHAGNVGNVTVATNMAGRGTDIAPTQEALSLGGLHVIGTEHASSGRVDRQLAGRAARQGNPGSSQFFVSAEDDLVRDTSLAKRILLASTDGGECRTSFANDIEQLQLRSEQESFEARRNLVQSDAWFDSARQTLN